VPVGAVGEIGVQAPAEIAVKLLGAFDVGDRDDDDLELGFDCSSVTCGGGFTLSLNAAHGNLRNVGPSIVCLPPPVRARIRGLSTSGRLDIEPLILRARGGKKEI
jgi:hypothetical protein